ncbi:MAG: ABC transporter permease [Planctomycetota bacterium]|nr:ABC transporter permease [Planctomycetota bacterium]
MMRGLPFEYAVRNLGRNPARLAMTAGGSMLVVLLVVAAASFVTGMRRSLQVSGSPHNAILLGAGSEESVERSEIAMRTSGIAAAGIPGVAQVAGADAVSPEIHAALPVRVGDRIATNTVVRGTTPEAFLVHREARLVEGRLPDVGADEVLAGRLAARNLGLDGPGASIGIDDREFVVVGILEADGGVIEGELWMPLSDLLIVTQRDTLSCVVLRRDETSMVAVDGFAATRLDLELSAIREDEYFAGLSDFFRPVRLMVIATAVLIAAGGVVGGLNTTYAAFASRIREIGTLRTLGYSKIAIVRTLVEESVLMASIGGLLAAVIARLLLDGLTIRFSMGAFGLSVGAPEIALGLAAGLVLGIAGALVPAIRCLRQSIPESLRAAT